MAVNGAFHVLRVSDTAAAVSFWRDAVGCVERFQTPGFAEVLAGDAVICLQRSPKAGGPTGLGIDVSDLDATCRAIDASTGEVVRGPESGGVPGLRTATVRDPDGNQVRLTEHR